MSLNLDDNLKLNLFKISSKQPETITEFPEIPQKQDLLFLQHPIEGNMIITHQDLMEKYGDQLLKKP